MKLSFVVCCEPDETGTYQPNYSKMGFAFLPEMKKVTECGELVKYDKRMYPGRN